MTQDTFIQDWRTHYAAFRCIEIIGEAARRVSEEFRDSHAEVPWRAMIAMRNALIHDYDDADLERVWDVAQNYIPPLILQISRLVPTEDDDSE